MKSYLAHISEDGRKQSVRDHLAGTAKLASEFARPFGGQEQAGLDSYVGFLHRDRPGRSSLALDLMEELRPCMADRFVLTLVNHRALKREDFEFRETGGVYLSDGGRRTFLKRWQERKRDTLTHPFLREKIPWGLVPYLQALLLARFLRGDLDEYPPFLWK